MEYLHLVLEFVTTAVTIAAMFLVTKVKVSINGKMTEMLRLAQVEERQRILRAAAENPSLHSAIPELVLAASDITKKEYT